MIILVTAHHFWDLKVYVEIVKYMDSSSRKRTRAKNKMQQKSHVVVQFALTTSDHNLKLYFKKLAPLPGKQPCLFIVMAVVSNLNGCTERALQLAMTCVAGRTLQFAASADAKK
jgi:hypothetical protein